MSVTRGTAKRLPTETPESAPMARFSALSVGEVLKIGRFRVTSFAAKQKVQLLGCLSGGGFFRGFRCVAVCRANETYCIKSTGGRKGENDRCCF